MGRKMSITQFDLKPVQSFRNKATRMTKFIEFWGADKPFSNITDSKLVQNLQITSTLMIESNLFPSGTGLEEINQLTLWYNDKSREKNYRKMCSIRFQYDFSCTCLLFLFVIIIQFLILDR